MTKAMRQQCLDPLMQRIDRQLLCYKAWAQIGEWVGYLEQQRFERLNIAG